MTQILALKKSFVKRSYKKFNLSVNYRRYVFIEDHYNFLNKSFKNFIHKIKDTYV